MKIFTTLFLLLAPCAVSLTSAQDRLADVAPIDRKMRTVDSISLVRIGEQASINDLQNPAASLYPSWDNEYTRTYDVALPSEYRIDLREFQMPCDSRMVTSHFVAHKSYGHEAEQCQKHLATKQL